MAIAKRTHLYPYRTQKLSSLASNVVGLTPCETRTLPGNSESLPFGRFFFYFNFIYFDFLSKIEYHSIVIYNWRFENVLFRR